MLTSVGLFTPLSPKNKQLIEHARIEIDRIQRLIRKLEIESASQKREIEVLEKQNPTTKNELQSAIQSWKELIKEIATLESQSHLLLIQISTLGGNTRNQNKLMK